nr:hypothetical protein [Tanacetum cinerariifolium]
MTTAGDGGSTASDGDGSGGGEGNLDLLRDKNGKSDDGGEDDDGKSGGGDSIGISFLGRRIKAERSHIDPRLMSRRKNLVGIHTKLVCDPMMAGACLTGKVVITSSESNMMDNGVNTPARGVVVGKCMGRGVVIVL